MTEYVLDLGFLIVGSIIAVFGGIVGIIWAKNIPLEAKLVNNKIKQYRERVEELEKELRKWRGKVSQSKQLPTVQGDYDLSDVGSVEALIKTVLPSIKGLLPKDLQGLADDPNVVKQAIELYNKNPDGAKKILGKFIKNKSTPTENEIAAL